MTARANDQGLQALAILLLLAQLPHILHLPIWVSVLGTAVVGLRLIAQKKTDRRLLQAVLSPLPLTIFALACALLVRFHYGYFFGRDPCVAFLFLLVACKLAELKRASDATLLMCLAAFLLLTQYFYSQSILSALITIPAVFALGNALAVLRDPQHARTTRTNLKLIGTMLLQGAPLAALLFVVFPRLPGPLWSLPEDSMARTGLSDSMSLGTISNLSKSDEVAFRVEFDSLPPSKSELYWRGPVLSEFDGRNWSTSSRLIDVTPRASQGADVLDYTVMLQPHRQRWLFALDLPASLPARLGSGDITQKSLARMTSDGQLLAKERVSKVLRYRQQSYIRDSHHAPIRPQASNLQLAGRNPDTVAHARALRASVNKDADYARAVLNWFNKEQFHYTLQPSLLGDSPVDEFLFGTREGFCEHYAAAFVVLMRAASIPARVVTGYQGGEMNGDYMIVRQSDAHAWAEAFIDGQWQRFDPTGAVAPSRVDAGLAAALPDSASVPRLARLEASWLRKAQLGWDAVSHDWQRLVVDFNNDSQFKLWQKLGLPKPALWQITVFVLLVAVVWSTLVLGLPWLRTARYASPAERSWLRYCALLEKHGVHREKQDSPGVIIKRACKTMSEHSDAITEIGDMLIALRFESIPERTRRKQLALINVKTTQLARALWFQRTVLRRQPAPMSL